MIHALIPTRRAEATIPRQQIMPAAPALFALIESGAPAQKRSVKSASQPANSNNVVSISVHLRFSRRR